MKDFKDVKAKTISLARATIDMRVVQEFQITRMQPIGESFRSTHAWNLSFDRRYCRGIEWWEKKKATREKERERIA